MEIARRQSPGDRGWDSMCLHCQQGSVAFECLQLCGRVHKHSLPVAGCDCTAATDSSLDTDEPGWIATNDQESVGARGDGVLSRVCPYLHGGIRGVRAFSLCTA